MRCLLDTHVFLWWVNEDRRLPEHVRSVIEDNENDIYFSAVSAWEIAIKAHLGRIELKVDPQLFITNQLEANRFRQLSIDIRHALGVFALPPVHRDPFDRLLVAQAIIENLVVLSQDSFIKQYDVPVIG